MHGEKIKIEAGDSAHSFFDCRADVEEFHIEKDALALLVLEFIGKAKPAAGQHA